MKPQFFPRSRMQRRAFLTAAGGLGIGLPFLEGLPGRSAWAQDDDPVFSLYLCTTCGVVPEYFYPSAETLTKDGLAADSDQAMSVLADYADRMTLVRQVHYPTVNRGCSHAEAFAMSLTGLECMNTGSTAMGAGPSIDNIVAGSVGLGVDSLNLYAGVKSGYINERLSFRAAGEVRSAENNPYQVYKDLLRDTGQSSAAPDAGAMVDYVTQRRQSVIDSVREELGILMAHPRLSELDKKRLQLHLDTLRDIELDATDMATAPSETLGCSSLALEESDYSAVSETYRTSGIIETVGVLQMRLAAFAFACNLNRVATLQWGDGTDASIYDVPSNSRKWGMHFVSHRNQSDGSVGNDMEAAKAHREIDRVRLDSFKRGLDHFSELGLLDRSVLYWTNQHGDGPSHTFVDLPAILVGSAGGRLRTGTILSGTSRNNDTLLNSLMSVAGVQAEDFIGSGEVISELLA
ncbi:MAG TPA: DUF1552 domain-containing protein [Polyangiaceae bacterium]|nr:DUF1552 domain-containing protein [Polyangiaceae bacterium]